MAIRDLTFNLNTRGDASTVAAMLRVAASMDALTHQMNQVNDRATVLDDSMQKVAKSSEKANKSGFKPLLDTALLLGPAIVPLGAAALAAGAAFGSMGAVGILAFKGIQAEMKAGTTLGKQYWDTFKPVVDEFRQLEHIAAANVFGGITKGVTQARTLFPLLNQDVAMLSTHLGSIVGNVGSGFIALLHDMNPLLVDLAGALDKGAAGFQHWATSSKAPAQFVAFAQAQLPKLEALFADVAKAVVHLGEAAAPIGGALLQALDGIAQAISRIPVPVLSAMILALDAARLWQIASGLSGISKALQAVALESGPVLTAASGLAAAFLGVVTPIGLAVAAGYALKAILSSLGVDIPKAAIDINALSKAGNDGSSGMSDIASTLTTQLTPAMNGLQSATGPAVDQLIRATLQSKPLQGLLDGTGQSIDTVTKMLSSSPDAWNLWITGLQKSMIAGGKNKAVVDFQVGSIEALRQAWQDSADAADGSTAAIQTQDEFLTANNLTVEKATKKYNDAVAAAHTFTAELGYMSKALDTLSGNAVTAELGQLKLTDAWAVGKGVDSALTQQVLAHGKSLNINTANGRANYEWALSQIQAINTQAISYAKATGSIGKGTDSLRINEAALRTSMIQAGFTTAQVDALLKKYAATPADVKTSITQQGAQAVIDALGDLEYWLHRIADPTWAAHIDIIAGAQAAQGGRPAAAAGGLLMGKGGPTSDNLLIRASPGEYVVNAAATAKNLPLLDSLNNNNNRIKAYAAGGLLGHLNITEAAAIHADITAAENKVRAAARASFGGGGSPGNFSGSLLSWVFGAEDATGTPASWTAAILRRIMFESGGNPNAINNWDSNAMAGDPSRGLMQTIGATFNAYHQPGTSSNIYDPVANIAAAINYIKSRYGSIFAIDPPVQGYRNGGMVDRTGLAFLHAGEEVLPNGYRGGGVTVAPGAITVYAAPGMDERRVAEQAFAQLRAWVADEQRRAAKGGRA